MKYLKATFQVFLNYRHLLKNLVARDFKVKYRRSFLGILWSLLNPLLMATVMAVVFSQIFARFGTDGLPTVSATGLAPNFLVYVLSGQLMFTFFNEATTSAMESVFANAGLIKKVYIPKYIFPLEKTLFSFVNMLFSTLALLLVIIFTRSPLSAWALLFPIPLLLMFIFNLGVGLILSSAVVFFRDIKHLYSVFVQALVYLTPIFWSEASVGPTVRLIVRFNPIYWYLSMFRQLVVYGRAPTMFQWLITIGCAAIAIVAGLIIFRKTQDDFILYI